MRYTRWRFLKDSLLQFSSTEMFGDMIQFKMHIIYIYIIFLRIPVAKKRLSWRTRVIHPSFFGKVPADSWEAYLATFTIIYHENPPKRGKKKHQLEWFKRCIFHRGCVNTIPPWSNTWGLAPAWRWFTSVGFAKGPTSPKHLRKTNPVFRKLLGGQIAAEMDV